MVVIGDTQDVDSSSGEHWPGGADEAQLSPDERGDAGRVRHLGRGDVRRAQEVSVESCPSAAQRVDTTRRPCAPPSHFRALATLLRRSTASQALITFANALTSTDVEIEVLARPGDGVYLSDTALELMADANKAGVVRHLKLSLLVDHSKASVKRHPTLNTADLQAALGLLLRNLNHVKSVQLHLCRLWRETSIIQLLLQRLIKTSTKVHVDECAAPDIERGGPFLSFKSACHFTSATNKVLSLSDDGDAEGIASFFSRYGTSETAVKTLELTTARIDPYVQLVRQTRATLESLTIVVNRPQARWHGLFEALLPAEEATAATLTSQLFTLPLQLLRDVRRLPDNMTSLSLALHSWPPRMPKSVIATMALTSLVIMVNDHKPRAERQLWRPATDFLATVPYLRNLVLVNNALPRDMYPPPWCMCLEECQGHSTGLPPSLRRLVVTRRWIWRDSQLESWLADVSQHPHLERFILQERMDENKGRLSLKHAGHVATLKLASVWCGTPFEWTEGPIWDATADESGAILQKQLREANEHLEEDLQSAFPALNDELAMSLAAGDADTESDYSLNSADDEDDEEEDDESGSSNGE